jgi:tagatose-1,6-bisphosphate aldolase
MPIKAINELRRDQRILFAKLAICHNVTAMCGPVPWSVLFAEVDHKTFLGPVDIAMRQGPSGIIATHFRA